ncbi:MAG: translation elongation factor 4 [Cyanobacteriota bacterium]|nr:translation elongation factor 4 [Cyanobacteriota bacterium]MDY6358730.1 translation elongation factor 4 [Cyanobacteriota bacterium]MDY6382825.1 translation elongation factor 4 [Cyanobacteriota bacterium]
MTKRDNVRNFCIIAHIDHGKSTLADRLLEKTGTVAKRDMQDQLLDSMDIERERGITIKLNAARMNYHAKDGNDYELNLIDTPGHVDFSYEVSRSLAACEGALLIVDATQGVEAQTLANVYLAIEQNLEIIPVINKIDLPSADVEGVKKEIEEILGLDTSMAIPVSAKTGEGVDEVLEAIVNYIPAPENNSDKPLRALIFDSVYDQYLGTVCYFKIVDGSVKVGDKVKFMATGKECEIVELGYQNPHRIPVEKLTCGDVGYFAGSIKELTRFVGDTLTTVENPAKEPLPGYKEALPMVFSGLYPVDNEDYADLKESLEKLKLNDSSITFEPETSNALGFGFRCGFLGMLHMEIVQERLEREYNLSLITTAPSVVYKVHKTNGEVIDIDNPSNLPDAQYRDYIEEPYVKVQILAPNDYVGTLMELAQSKRGIFKNMVYLDKTRVDLTYEIPLSEVITDFYDQLKSRTKGYASMDYEFCGYKRSNLVKLDIMLAGEVVDALSVICHADSAYHIGQKLTVKLKEIIPKQLFEVPIQAAVGGRIIARTNIKAMRKNVLAKCYGGDITRKRKLLEKQKKGKKRMKSVGSVEIPQEAFMAILSLDEES